MKKLFFSFLLTSEIAFAAPIASVDASIEVQQHGRTDTYSGKDYLIVSREKAQKFQKKLDDLRKELAEAKREIQALSNKEPVEVVEDVVVSEIVVAPPQPDKLNRISVRAGVGPDGLAVRGDTVKPRIAPLVGISYARKFEEYSPWNWDGQLLGGVSPKSQTFIGTVGIGYDF